MLPRLSRWLVSVFVLLAFVGGATAQAMVPAAQFGSMPGCAEMTMTDVVHAPMPSKAVTPDCMRSMQCLAIPDRAVTLSMVAAPVSYAAVAYWAVHRPMDGVTIPPPASPPKPV